jgi:hypothetical protein
MQLIIIVSAAILGLAYGHYADGFIFSSKICLFAGLTLIMPALFDVKLRDIRLLLTYKTVIAKSILANYLLLPAIALIIGLISHDFGIAAGLFLLSVLSGGGMVMHWIKKSDADTSIGFILLLINLLLISLSLLMAHIFGIYTSGYFGASYENEVNISNFARAVIILLIVVPFIASRVILYIKPLKDLIEKTRSIISTVSIFVIIAYLFGLQNSQRLFELYDFEPELIPLSLVAVLAFYICVFLLSRLLYDLDSKQQRAAFWHSITRYITLALVISTFTINTFGVSMILPIMFAYIVQIPLAIYIDKSTLFNRT